MSPLDFSGFPLGGWVDGGDNVTLSLGGLCSSCPKANCNQGYKQCNLKLLILEMHMQTNTDFRPHLGDKNIELRVPLILSAIYQIEKISGTYLAMGKERWNGVSAEQITSHLSAYFFLSGKQVRLRT